MVVPVVQGEHEGECVYNSPKEIDAVWYVRYRGELVHYR